MTVRVLSIGILLCLCSVFGATRTWNSTGSTDANNGSNYSPTGVIPSTDTLLLDGTSVVNWILTDSLRVAQIQTTSSYTGSINYNGKVLSVTDNARFAGTGTLNMTGTHIMTGDQKIIEITSGPSFMGGTLSVKGDRDTVKVQNSVYNGISFKCLSVADSGKTTYFKCTSNNLTWPFVDSILRINGGEVSIGISAYLFLNIKTSRPIETVGTSTIGASSTRGFTIVDTNSTINKIYIPKMSFSGGLQPLFQNFSSPTDTFVFEDSLTCRNLRFLTNNGSIVVDINRYLNTISGLNFQGNTTSYFVKVNFHSSIVVATIQFLGNVVLSLDSCSMYYDIRNSGYTWNPSTATSAVINPGYATIKFVGPQTVTASSKLLPSVICSTAVGNSITLADSVPIQGSFLVLSGGLTCNNPIKTTGSFYDSSSTDTTIFKSIYLGGNAHFSQNSKLGWYPNAKIVAQGTVKQTVYSNGKALPKIIVAKGAKLTIR